MSLKYQSHVDGLRAVAVLSVIIFHINKYILPGGFIGVDIFFVISGYLISKQIYQELDNNSFSLLEFYRRRIKRILPAAFVVIGLTTIIAQFLYLPNDAAKVSESALWSVFSVANIYFWRFQDTGYFANSSYEIPLLHLWSLGVEEQFYIFWPLVLLLVYRFLSKTSFVLLTVLTIFVSSAIGYFLYDISQSFVYYNLPSRAGELLVGALLAYLSHKEMLKPELNKNQLNLISIIGLAALIASFIFINEEVLFPGFYVLIPTLATAVIIWAGANQESTVLTFLNHKVLIFIGRISFSAYLWHWPILAFYRYGYGEVTLTSGVIIFCLILLSAWISYTLVEQRYRFSKEPFKQVFYKQFIIPSSLLIILSSFIIGTNGLGVRAIDQQYANKLSFIENKAISPNKYDYVCQYWKVEKEHLEDQNCIVGNKSEEPDILLWGDSNAAHYIGILGYFAEKLEWSFRNVHHAACPPINLSAKEFVTKKVFPDCQSSLEKVLPAIDNYQTIIVSASYTFYQEQSNDFMHKFKNMAIELANKGKRVVILGKLPVFYGFDRKCKEKALSYPLLSCETANYESQEEVNSVNIELANFADKHEAVHYFDFNSFICGQQCSPYDEEGNVLYFDRSHLEIGASWQLGKQIFDSGQVPQLFYSLGAF